MTRKLIHFDRHGFEKLETAVNEACQGANELIELYNEIQPWHTISSRDEADRLIAAPLAYLDSTLTSNIEFKAAGMKPDPGKLAELFSIDRAGFQNRLLGLVVVQPDCEGCGEQPRTEKTPKAIHPQTFRQYADYLKFNGGAFVVDGAKLKAAAAGFETRADSPKAIEIVTHYEKLIEILNTHDEKYGLNFNDKDALKKIFSLHLSRGSEGTFQPDSEHLKKLITLKNR